MINRITNVIYEYLKPLNSFKTNDQYQIELFVLYRNTWNHLTVHELLCRRMFRYQPVWFEHGTLANKQGCWNGFCYRGHVTRSGACMNGSDRSRRCRRVRGNVTLWVNIAFAFHTQYSALYVSKEIIRIGPNYPPPPLTGHYRSGDEESFRTLQNKWMSTNH